jgi:hypothetical protein
VVAKMSRARDLGSSINSPVAGKNALINGGCDIWQRGTSFPSGVGLSQSVVYSADRWHWYRGNNDTGATLTRQSAGLTGFNYCMRIQRNSGNTSTQTLGLRYTLETADSLRFAGKTITFSFYARKGSDYSATGSLFRVFLPYGTGTDQVVHSFTGFTQALSSSTVTLTSTWTRFTFTGSIPSNATEIGLEMFADPTGTAGANDYMEITGLQLEEGSVPTSFSRAGGDIQGELAKCQRYYYRDTLEKHLTHVRDTNLWFITKTFPVRMRSVVSFSHNLTTKVTPGTFPGTAGQIGIYSNGWVAQNATALSCSSDGGSNDHGSFYIVGFNGTLGQVGSIQSNGASYFEWSGEL